MLRFSSYFVQDTTRYCVHRPAACIGQVFYFVRSLGKRGLLAASPKLKDSRNNTAAATPSVLSDTAHVIQPRLRKEHIVDRATSSEVWEMEKGIFASWVQDALGFHIPVGAREEPSAITTAKGNEDNILDPESFPTVGADQKELFPKAVCEGVQIDLTHPVEETKPDVDIHVITDSRRRSSSLSGQSHTGSFTFYGPLSAFEVSPVFEWVGCLWQWRPIEVRHVRHVHRRGGAADVATFASSIRSYSAAVKQWESNEDDGNAWDHTVQRFDKNDTEMRKTATDAHFYLVPFLLLPTNEVASGRPRLDAQLRDNVLNRHTKLYENSNCPSAYDSFLCELEQQVPSLSSTTALPATLFALTAPMPIGDLALEVTSPRNGTPPLSVFSTIEYRLATNTGDAVIAPLIAPSAETWEAATTLHKISAVDGTSQTSKAPCESVLPATAPYVRVYHSDVNKSSDVLPHAEEKLAGSCSGADQTIRHPQRQIRLLLLPATRRNVIGGGLAELLLTVDRYAALIARGELTLSAACWATLCDTKSWWVVQKLRLTPREVERELLAATAAHRRWHRRAIAVNHTLVGKSSHAVLFDDYPLLAHWVGN